MIEVCAIALASAIHSAQPKLSMALREWIAHNVCRAAHDTGTDPVWLGAYMLTENRAIDLWAVVPASCGNDHSLFQLNSCYQHARKDFARVHHPYYGACVAAQILRENLATFGWRWQAFSAYWNPDQSRRGTAAAKAYYARYHANAQFAQQAFADVRRSLAHPSSVAAPADDAASSKQTRPKRFTGERITG
jgi:hypothetical protein